MTTNIDRAAHLIAMCITRDSDPAEDIADLLAEYDLLAPDPVEPEGIERLSWGTIADWHPTLGLGWNDDGMICPTTPEDLRHEAACLLSAAAYAEEHTDDQ